VALRPDLINLIDWPDNLTLGAVFG
jgi:hypothetical protein